MEGTPGGEAAGCGGRGAAARRRRWWHGHVEAAAVARRRGMAVWRQQGGRAVAVAAAVAAVVEVEVGKELGSGEGPRREPNGGGDLPVRCTARWLYGHGWLAREARQTPAFGWCDSGGRTARRLARHVETRPVAAEASKARGGGVLVSTSWPRRRACGERSSIFLSHLLPLTPDGLDRARLVLIVRVGFGRSQSCSFVGLAAVGHA